jgi:hypothetical protein
MGRRLKIDRPQRLEVHIPTSLYEKVRAELYSDLEGRVPFGAWSNVIAQSLTEWLRERGIVV